VDTTPIVGRLGTGVEVNEVYTIFEQARMKQTENDFDLALEGRASHVSRPGERLTRNGAFLVDVDGTSSPRTATMCSRSGADQAEEEQLVIDETARSAERGVRRGRPAPRLDAENQWERWSG